MELLDTQIEQWRDYLRASDAISAADADELELHLRDQIEDLISSGLAEDEAYLIAVKRLGKIDELTREFAREHIDRLWKQLVPLSTDEASSARNWMPALLCAFGAAAAIQVAWRAMDFENSDQLFVLNLGFVVLPFLAIYFAWTRELGIKGWLLTAAPFVILAPLVNLYPFGNDSDTALLVALHLPVLLWFAVGLPYMDGSWRIRERRMDFVRFTGEWLIYYTLIVLGGAVLMALTALLLEPATLDDDWVFEWMMPSGGAAGVIVAAWLVDAKQRVVENMAPVLVWIFTPLFSLMLVVALVTSISVGLGDSFDRDLLTVLDALLIVVLGLVIYGLSARGPQSPPALMDGIQLVALASALLLDIMVLGSMALRIEELGLTPNRVAAVGLNLLLLVNLTGAAVLSTGYIFKRVRFQRLTDWQLWFLPSFAVWATLVVVALPPLFDFN